MTKTSTLITYEVTLGYEGELAKIITLKTHLGPDAAARRARHSLFMADRGQHDEMPIVVGVEEIDESEGT